MTGNIYISGQIGTFDGTPGTELIDIVSQVKSQPKATAFNVHINSEGGLVDVGSTSTTTSNHWVSPLPPLAVVL